jgi:hypothetical protein
VATKLAPGFYEVSPVETLFITVSGPFDPLVALDGLTLQVTQGVQFALTPQMLAGSGAHHFLNIVVLFPTDGTPSNGYLVDVADANGVVESLTQPTPDLDNSAKIQLMVRVA